ncbi:MAG: hypothetical protein JWR04_933 [Rhodoglobus sp.]|jgi:uncharacterized membrane protein YeaQ/YmgE (transglycosylase-associated protein family)|nr:hypothetical protein [Rhodoglobus sp.]
MSFFPFLLVGIVAAIVAKLILRRKVGWFLTIVLGLLGAALGAWVASAVLGYDVFGDGGLTSPLTWVFALGGAIVVLLIQGLIFGRRKTS